MRLCTTYILWLSWASSKRRERRLAAAGASAVHTHTQSTLLDKRLWPLSLRVIAGGTAPDTPMGPKGKSSTSTNKILVHDVYTPSSYLYVTHIHVHFVCHLEQVFVRRHRILFVARSFAEHAGGWCHGSCDEVSPTAHSCRMRPRPRVVSEPALFHGIDSHTTIKRHAAEGGYSEGVIAEVLRTTPLTTHQRDTMPNSRTAVQ